MAEKAISESKKIISMERLEKRGWQLWILAIFIILALVVFIIFSYLEELSGSPRGVFKQFFFINTYLIGSAVLILVFCVYLLFKNRELRRLRKEVFMQKGQLERMAGSLEEVMAFFQISSVIKAKKDLPTILETIARESLSCLKADRSTVFLVDSESGILKTQFTYAPNPLDEPVSQLEEKEVARKVLHQSRSLLLREPEDFVDFFKYDEGGRKITSLLSISLSARGKSIGSLSVALIDGERKFNEEDLKLLSLFGNHASIAMENSNLAEEVRQEANLRKSYEGCFNDLLKIFSQNLSAEERKRVEEPIKKLLDGKKFPGLHPLEPQWMKPAAGLEKTIILSGKLGDEQRRDERREEVLRVDFEDESAAQTLNLSEGGIFIRTPDPLDPGDQFLLKLHVPDGREPIEVVCKVVWTNKYGKEGKGMSRGMGVKFLNLHQENRKRIEEYIKLQKSGGLLPGESLS